MANVMRDRWAVGLKFALITVGLWVVTESIGFSSPNQDLSIQGIAVLPVVDNRGESPILDTHGIQAILVSQLSEQSRHTVPSIATVNDAYSKLSLESTSIATSKEFRLLIPELHANTFITASLTSIDAQNKLLFKFLLSDGTALFSTTIDLPETVDTDALTSLLKPVVASAIASIPYTAIIRSINGEKTRIKILTPPDPSLYLSSGSTIRIVTISGIQKLSLLRKIKSVKVDEIGMIEIATISDTEITGTLKPKPGSPKLAVGAYVDYKSPDMTAYVTAEPVEKPAPKAKAAAPVVTKKEDTLDDWEKEFDTPPVKAKNVDVIARDSRSEKPMVKQKVIVKKSNTENEFAFDDVSQPTTQSSFTPSLMMGLSTNTYTLFQGTSTVETVELKNMITYGMGMDAWYKKYVGAEASLQYAAIAQTVTFSNFAAVNDVTTKLLNIDFDVRARYVFSFGKWHPYILGSVGYRYFQNATDQITDQTTNQLLYLATNVYKAPAIGVGFYIPIYSDSIGLKLKYDYWVSPSLTQDPANALGTSPSVSAKPWKITLFTKPYKNFGMDLGLRKQSLNTQLSGSGSQFQKILSNAHFSDSTTSYQLAFSYTF